MNNLQSHVQWRAAVCAPRLLVGVEEHIRVQKDFRKTLNRMAQLYPTGEMISNMVNPVLERLMKNRESAQADSDDDREILTTRIAGLSGFKGSTEENPQDQKDISENREIEDLNEIIDDQQIKARNSNHKPKSPMNISTSSITLETTDPAHKKPVKSAVSRRKVKTPRRTQKSVVAGKVPNTPKPARAFEDTKQDLVSIANPPAQKRSPNSEDLECYFNFQPALPNPPSEFSDEYEDVSEPSPFKKRKMDKITTADSASLATRASAEVVSDGPATRSKKPRKGRKGNTQ